jgi:sucrose-6-phosphate hydrolase SacC (GH32 family)
MSTTQELKHRRVLLSALALGAFASAFAADAEPTYREPFRPQFHFTPAKNWMNDPNGMVFYDGEYHLFYQYNPFGDKWGHMSWGHAVSPDMIHWKHLPVALAEENGVMIFSGSAVVDWKNTSGFGQNGKPPLIAIYTGHYTNKPLQNQHIAYSNDRGRTWTKYAGNPVLDIGEKDFRDPKVFWHEPTKRWVMVVSWPTERKVRFYASSNFKEWKHLSDFGPAGATQGIWECPDLFPLPIEGHRKDSRWALIVNVGSGAVAGGSGTQYFVGRFDGNQFTLDPSYPHPQPESVPDGKVLADFEAGYGNWQVSGEAFGTAPARGTLPNQQAVAGFRGHALANSYLNGDRTQGRLVSPEFGITEDFITFLIGGGNHPGKTCINLLVNDQAIRTATGNNSEHLSWKSWDVRDLRGQHARLEIVDQHSEGWGHINVDHIVMADRPGRPATQPALWADYAPDFYAAVSWSDIPKHDGRRLWLGWMSNWQYAGDVPTSPWRSAMSLPRELTLRQTADGLRLVQKPVQELRKIRGERFQKKNLSVGEANDWLKSRNIGGPLWEIEAEIDVQKESDFALKVFGTPNQPTILHWDAKREVLTLDRTHSGRADFNPQFSGKYEAPLKAKDGKLHLHLFVDTSSIEIFGNDGQTALTALIFPNESTVPFSLESTDGKTKFGRLRIWKLKAAVPITSTISN